MLNTYSDIETATELWDMLGDKSIVYFPVLMNENNKSLFLERFEDNNEKNIIRIFINKDEANSYGLAQNKPQRTSVAKCSLRSCQSA